MARAVITLPSRTSRVSISGYLSSLYRACPLAFLIRVQIRVPRYRGVPNEEGGVDIEAPLRYDSIN